MSHPVAALRHRARVLVGSVVFLLAGGASGLASAPPVGLAVSPTVGAALVAEAGEAVSRVEVTRPMVALTFDDGPREPYTSEILDVLRDQGVHATFFLVGENARRYPELVRRMVREGHAIGNHSWSHESMSNMSWDQAYREIDRTDRTIFEASGYRTSLFRPPYGASGPVVEGARSVPRQRGQVVVMWSVEVSDWSTRSPLRVAAGTASRVRPGAIVLLHDGGGDRAHTVTGTRWLVAHLARRGFEMVTVPELLGAARARTW